MLLMVWAQARFSDESNLVNNYVGLLKFLLLCLGLIQG